MAIEGAILSIRQAARELNIPPRVISDAKYQGRIDATLFTTVGKTTLVSRADLPRIEAALREAGKLPKV